VTQALQKHEKPRRRLAGAVVRIASTLLQAGDPVR
jgi:hypothetical protein